MHFIRFTLNKVKILQSTVEYVNNTERFKKFEVRFIANTMTALPHQDVDFSKTYDSSPQPVPSINTSTINTYDTILLKSHELREPSIVC